MSQQLLRENLMHLQSALKAAALYPQGHPGIQRPLHSVVQGLSGLLVNGRSLVLGVIDDVLVFDEIPFYDTDSALRTLFAGLRGRGIESLTLETGLDVDDVQGLIRVLKGGDAGDPSDLNGLWKSQNIRHITYREMIEGDDFRARAVRTYEESLKIVVDMMAEIRLGRVPSSRHAVGVVDEMKDLILRDPNALLGMSMMKAYDEYTYNHSVNVAIFCLSLGRHLELRPDELRAFGLAGLLHDMGKVRTDESIIKKPGALDDREMRQMQLHPELGAEILESMRGMHPDARTMVLQHHIRYDRTGYPSHEASGDVHPLAEAVGMSDCYDALTTTRPYQRERHPGDAMRILRRNSGTAYRPDLVESFVAMLGAYPVGETVRLATSEIAVVVANNPLDATSPTVRLVYDCSSQPLQQSIRVELADPSEAHRRVVTALDPLAKGIDVAAILEEELTQD